MTRRVLIPLAIVAFAGLPSQAKAGVVLGSAESFAVLGGSTVTNTNSTTIFGDLGVWPGESIIGFPPGIVTGGTIHAGDAIAQQAQSDLTTAYVALADMPFSQDLTGQDLGGLTLTPGVYRFSSLAQLTGELTLDGLGDPNALFVIQVGNELTTASNSSVNMINGGDSNVYWVIGSSATLGTGTEFAGSLLALTSITLDSGTSIVNGRALARNGAVTMDNNNIAIPEPATVLLLGCGLASLLAAGKKRRNSVAWIGSAGEPVRSLWSAHKTTPDNRRASHIRLIRPATKTVEKFHTKTDPANA